MSDTEPTPAPESETYDPTQLPTTPVETEPGEVYPSDLSSSADAGPHDVSSAERMGATSDERDLAELAHRAELPENRPADHPELGQTASIDESPADPADSVAAQAPEQSE